MCGIAGDINFYKREYDDQIYLNMMNSIKKRGPDQDGIFKAKNAVLVHTRLSVVDLENGIQPMTFMTERGNYTVVYNGELYNTEEIRKLLVEKKYNFKGHSDTEVLLYSFVEWGAECVEMFNGIFAFAIWDEVEEKLFIARDRIGVKPLFFGVMDGEFVFGSEIKSILCHPLFKSEIDINSISDLMLLGPGRTPGFAVFKNIKELKPANCGFFSKEGLKIYKYWELKDKQHTENFEETVEKVRYLVTDSITRQLVSDVPVCTFLSGGLDSSIISSIASSYFKERGETLHTFSVDYFDNDKHFKKSTFQPNSDDNYINIMTKYLGSKHEKFIIDTPQLVDALYSSVDARDLPGMADVDASLFLFCKEVKRHSTVALSGECADEIFGGYPWYRDEKVRNEKGFPWSKSYNYRLSFLKDDVAEKIDSERYVFERYNKTLEETSKIDNLSPTECRMKEMVKLNLDWFMQTLLDRKDRMSMANGLEVRVPFCDYRIAEYLYSVPWDFKNYENREKGLLRKAMEHILPEEIAWRKKSPYPKTHNPAYLTAVSSILSDIISSPNAPILQILKKPEIEKLINSKSQNPWYGQLMTVPQTIAYFIQINYWLEKYKISIN